MAFIADAVVSKVLDELTSLAIEELKQEVRLVVGVKEEVEKLAKNLLAIQAVLTDAEQKQLNDVSIGLWLNELKDISYEMDDVLDEWRSAMLMMSIDRETNNHDSSTSSSHKWSLCTFVTSCCIRPAEIRLRHDIARKIKDLDERLGLISLRRDVFGLVSNVGFGVGKQVQRTTTISSIDTSDVKGRGKETEKIINKLLSSASSSESAVPRIISIVGMGGLGKTTLAQLAYNDKNVKEHFGVTIWVCVSDPFDETKILKTILESLEKKDIGGLGLDTTVEEIKTKIGGRKFLLVLDDVWNEDRSKWANVKAALSGGSPGSTILVTTRKDRVANTMECAESNLIRPGVLSRDDCWDIISSEVVKSGMTKERLQQLQGIGKQIADKCKGLPLAAKALGGLLSIKESKREWQSILGSKMWQLGEEEANIEGTLFAPLWLSYHDLSPSERQCLSYCACFPKDTKINKDDLIKLWMGQGYVKDAKTKDMGMVAEEYFRILCKRSFFQDFEFDRPKYDSEVKAVKMHDIVHDFILFISKKECLCIEASDIQRLDSTDKAVSHLFVFLKSVHEKFPTSVFSFSRLRSLAVQNCNGLDLNILFRELRCLRSLVLRSCDLRVIPSTIGKLIHLRLLDLSTNVHLRELPETVGDLFNLIVLDVRSCESLEKMPRGIAKLSNLRYLRNNRCNVRLTQGIGSLGGLRQASFLVDGESTSLGNLNNMSHLTCVRISLGSNMEHVVGAEQAKLNEKRQLVSLILSFHSQWTQEEAERRKTDDEKVIEALQPCSNLEKLEISNFLGVKSPSWLLSLNHLQGLELRSWQNCKYLPPLGMLPSLAFLCIRSGGVTRVGHEFLGNGISSHGQMSHSDVAFPKLKTLWLLGLGEWEEWDMDVGPHFSIMPSLTNLSVDNCKKLKSLPDLILHKEYNYQSIRGSTNLLERYPEFNKGMDVVGQLIQFAKLLRKHKPTDAGMDKVSLKKILT